jgi:transcriptional regulator of aromatic amino acid metabolism
MSEEGEIINENTNLEEELPTEHEAEPEPELEPEPSGKIISPVAEEGGIEEAATEETMREPGESLKASRVEQVQLEQKKPKKRATKTTIMKIQSFLADISKQIEKQSTQINKINQNLLTLQKQMRAGERQTVIVNQIRSQVNQIQKQISQVHKSVQKASTGKLQLGKKKIRQ